MKLWWVAAQYNEQEIERTSWRKSTPKCYIYLSLTDPPMPWRNVFTYSTGKHSKQLNTTSLLLRDLPGNPLRNIYFNKKKIKITFLSLLSWKNELHKRRWNPSTRSQERSSPGARWSDVWAYYKSHQKAATETRMDHTYVSDSRVYHWLGQLHLESVSSPTTQFML